LSTGKAPQPSKTNTLFNAIAISRTADA